jgi:hypothetical protein
MKSILKNNCYYYSKHHLNPKTINNLNCWYLFLDHIYIKKYKILKEILEKK